MSKSFYFSKERFFSNKEIISLLNNRFEEIYKNNIYKSNHSHIREITAKSISKEPLFEEIMKKIHKKFEKITDFLDLKFDKLWLVRSRPNNANNTTLPYIPHIDKRRYLKAMVYLHDVHLEHGPIHLGKLKNDINIEQKRKELPLDYKEKGLNSIKNDEIDGKLNPITGKAGDVIFFDTNTPHKAGIIDKGYSREVLRFDFERTLFNPKQSLLNYLINKFPL